MKNAAVRKKVNQYLDKVDDKMLLAIYSILESYVKSADEVLGYEANGKPLTKAELIRSVKKSAEEVKAGKFHSQETVEKFFKSKMRNGKAA